MPELSTLTVKDIGSFFVGGIQARLSGREVREVHFAKDAPPLRVDPNGRYPSGHIYVQFVRLERPSGLPIVFLNGGTFTGAMWETTPDGRPGWQRLFLGRGHDTYLSDAVGRGRSGFSPFPEIFRTAPLFRPIEETSRLLRIGSFDEQERLSTYLNTQFPVSQFDAFVKQSVPRFAGSDELERDAFAELLSMVGPCIVIAQSSGGYLATELAARNVGTIAAIVTVEMTAFPYLGAAELQALTGVPQLILWGDHIANSQMWQTTRSASDRYAETVNRNGGNVTNLDLPSIGHFGNTHQMMMDLNNADIAALIGEWLDRRH